MKDLFDIDFTIKANMFSRVNDSSGFRRNLYFICEWVEQDLKVCVHLLLHIWPINQVYVNYADASQLGETWETVF